MNLRYGTMLMGLHMFPLQYLIFVILLHIWTQHLVCAFHAMQNVPRDVFAQLPIPITHVYAHIQLAWTVLSLVLVLAQMG